MGCGRYGTHTILAGSVQRTNRDETDLTDDFLALIAEGEIEELGRLALRLAVRIVERRAGIGIGLGNDRGLGRQRTLDRKSVV